MASLRSVPCVWSGVSELLAADLFRNAEQTRARITFGDVQRYLAQLASHSPDCDRGGAATVSRVSAQRVSSVRCVKPGCVHCVDSIALTVADRRFRAIVDAHRRSRPIPVTPAASVILIPRTTAAVVLRDQCPDRADSRAIAIAWSKRNSAFSRRRPSNSTRSSASSTAPVSPAEAAFGRGAPNDPALVHQHRSPRPHARPDGQPRSPGASCSGTPGCTSDACPTDRQPFAGPGSHQSGVHHQGQSQ